MNSPVLFIIFNRPNNTKIVFDAIRSARPKSLYIAADGPRSHRPDDAMNCKLTREIVSEVDWPCKVITLFRTENLGCRLAVSSALNWFFSFEEEGIILEDDTVPQQSFFKFCDQMLHVYRNVESIGHISGSNFISTKKFNSDQSYFFSIYPMIWGWATWRRAWILYDIEMESWPEYKFSPNFKLISGGDKGFEIFWGNLFDNAYSEKPDTWDYQWALTCWVNQMISITPAINQIKNIGFGANATHTSGKAPGYVRDSAPEELAFPLIHPEKIIANGLLDKEIAKRVFGINLHYRLKNKIKKIPLVKFLRNKLRNC